ncbi:DUF4132 domain-containing protein [Marinomonas mediterranea]|uniref:DUF4132 domain-containing protein n=1 Tax=Marinomonas mediterranea TaxID=119864 RepID=UPI00234AD427|nr:DUF4132 domain-containing protein [Marinomonas mediterranea]WCN12764.1 DUF4132 domain-containing protein [Marinomonas mediterranea]
MNLFSNVLKFVSKNSTEPSIQRVSKTGIDLSQLIEKVICELKSKKRLYDISLSYLESGKAVMALTPEESLDILMVALVRLGNRRHKQADNWGIDRYEFAGEEAIIRGVLKRSLPYTRDHILLMLKVLSEAKTLSTYQFPIAPIVKATEIFYSDSNEDMEAKKLLEKIAENIHKTSEGRADERRLADRVLRILSSDGNAVIPISMGEAWGDQAVKDIQSFDESIQLAWSDLFKTCQNTKPSKPSKKWIKEAQTSLDKIGRENFVKYTTTWFSLLDKPRTITLTRRNEFKTDLNLVFNDSNADLIKGLVWCCSIEESSEIASALTKVGIISFKKIPGVGAKSTRIGNAVIYALSAMPGRSGLYQLAVLKIKVKYRHAISLLEKSLAAAAEREGFSVDELAEMGVPSFGLDDVGLGEEVLGDFTALLTVSGFNSIDLTWRKEDGKIQKTVPSLVKENFGAELKELKGNIKDIKSMLSIQKERLENLFLIANIWDFDTWKDRYINHPLVGVFARKLIWMFEDGDNKCLAIFEDDLFKNVSGDDVSEIVKESKVSLWHPISSSVEEIRAWRERLYTLELTQPFKQAHREVYLLTDAERTTNTYSNRFASHVIKQHQFNALASTRGWHYTLQGAWDGGYDDICSIRLDQYNLYAQFWVNTIGEYGNDTSESGIFLYVSSDQVRFYEVRPDMNGLNDANINRDQPIPLEQVPALVFSEIFRDVDLFVGICSVGNDPEWSDGGPDGRYSNYWHEFSFGDLSASAQTRKEIFKYLVPKLKIGSQCKFIDKFLVVEGKRRIYKIHLGSGNILMEPNNQYLCIVTDSKKHTMDKGVFLPFEGDKTLSMILSKAVLLAADDKIKDPLINAQIDHR